MVEFIKSYWVFGLGIFAQTVFGIRVLVQWWHAEKKRDSVSPIIFWRISLLGSLLFLLYGILRNDMVIIVGQLISYFIYIRNIQLKNDWRTFPIAIRVFLLLFPVVVLIVSSRMLDSFSLLKTLEQNWSILLVIGIIGQLALNFRFIYQLYYSERKKESLLPSGFWWISLVGSCLLVFYSIYKPEPVLLLAQSLALIPYIRNLILSKKK